MYVQQAVGLAGMQSKEYDDEIYALQDIMDSVKDASPKKVDDNKNPTYASVTSFSNRMFSPKNEDKPVPACKLSQFEDPEDKLARKASRAGIVHTEENKVEYLRLQRGL